MKNKHRKLLTALFIIGSFTVSLIVAPENSYAEHTLSLSATSAQVIDVSNSGTGTTISETEVSVATTCQAGYNLSFSTTVSDNNLYLNGDANNSATGSYFSPSDGVASLASADNTWGYYLPGDGEVPTAETVFSAVPTLNHPATLKTPAQTASDSEINDVFSIYYGVKVSGTMHSGKYTMINDDNDIPGTIVYYATLPESCLRYTVEYNPTGTNTGISITGTGSVANQTIAEGIPTDLTTEVYGNPVIDETTYYFIGWNTAQDGTGVSYSSGQSVTDLAAAGDSITLYAQWTDCLSGRICYHKNGTNITGSIGEQTLSSADTSATLLASNFSREDYGFAGWSTSRDYDGNFYGPNETISFEAGQYTDGSEGLSLYAVWVETNGSIQDWAGCDDLTPVSYDSATGLLTADLSSITALTDLRDNQTYTIARLADGNCWTIENLRLSSEYTRGATSPTLSQGYGQSEAYGNFIGLADAENSNYLNTTTANTIYGIAGGSTVNIGASDFPAFRLPRYNDANITSRATSPDAGSLSLYGYGNYYNWPASMASTEHYSSGDNSNLAGTSLCPSGWRLPYGSNTQIGGHDGDMATLDIAMGGNGGTNSINAVSNESMSYYWRKFPNNVVYSGSIGNSTISSRGSEGYLWTTTAFNDEKSYGFSINNSYINPGADSYQKYYGFSVRCIKAS